MKTKTTILIMTFIFSLLLTSNALSLNNNISAKSLYENKCSRCHDLDIINSAVKSPSQWESTVERMRLKNTDWISQDEGIIILTYLASNNSSNGGNDNSGHSYMPVSLPKLLGFVTFGLLLTTVSLGFAMTHGKRKLFKIHKVVAYITLISAVVHGILIFITY